MGMALKEQQLYPATTSAAASALHSSGLAPVGASMQTANFQVLYLLAVSLSGCHTQT